MKQATMLGACAIVALSVTGCCTYHPETTRATFRELSEDARDLRVVVERCIADPTGNKAECDAVLASLDSIAEEADHCASLGHEGGEP